MPLQGLSVYTISAILGPLLTLVYRSITNRRRSNISHVPRAPARDAHWLYGHELALWREDFTAMYSHWAREMGSVYRMKAAFGHDDLLVAADQFVARQVLADTDTFIKAPTWARLIENIGGRGIVWAEGDEHRLQRRALASSFSSERVREMAPIVMDSAEKIIKSISDTVRSGTTSINVTEVMSICTLDIIGRVAFGYEFFPDGVATSEASDILHGWKDVAQNQNSFLTLCGMALIRRVPWISRLPIKVFWEQGVVKRAVTPLAGDMLAGAADTDRGDVLTRLVRAGMKDGDPGVDPLNAQRIVDNIIHFILAGHETTTSVVGLALLTLARKPAVQARLRQEIPKHRDITYEDIQSANMPYLDAVTKEALRLYPAAPSVARITARDTVLPLKRPITGKNGTLIHEVRVKKGTEIVVPYITINQDIGVWGADADEFKPDRWLGTDGIPPVKESAIGWNGMLSFSDGPRICLGYRLAVLEVKMILAMMVKSFNFDDAAEVLHIRACPTLVGMVGDEIGVIPLRVSRVEDEELGR